MKDNFVLNNELQIELLRNFSYAQVLKFIDNLKDAVTDLEQMKEIAVMCGNDTKAVELQRYSHNAQHNKLLLEQVLNEKEEAVTFKEADIRTIFLN